MNNQIQDLHYLQKELLMKLSLSAGLRFNELIIEGLESEHVNYHLKKLIQIKFISKISDLYILTDLGKDYVNKIDDTTNELERQPKTSVVITGKRINKNGEVEHLLYRRLKQPYFRKIGRIGGKVKFGETLEEAASRELFEETGLRAKNFVLETIYHKLRHREDGEFVQDVIFYIFFVTDFEGEFLERTPFQENFWLTNSNKDAYQKDFFDDLHFDDSLNPKPLSIVESVKLAEGY